MVQINFRAGENTGGGWTPLPEGTCLFEIKALDVGSSKKGNPQIAVSLDVLDGPREGGTAKTWYSLMPKAGWNLRGLLDALDIEYSVGDQDNKGQDDLTFDGDDLIGRRVEYYVKQREWEGKINNDFTNPRDPDYVEGDEAEGANAPTVAAPVAPPVEAPAAPRRRPRPAR